MEFDKFYTNIDVAKKLIKKTKEIIDFNSIDVILEPSAGNGSFLFLLDDKKRYGIDILPDNSEIVKMDFFNYNPIKNKKYLTIGNPPFGKISSLAVKFFNKASEFSDYVCFIVPRTFKRISVQNRLNLNMYLIYEENIPFKSFTPNMMAKCVYQIWEKRTEKRQTILLDSTVKDFKFLKINEKNDADFALLAYGGKCGRIVKDIPNSGLKSWHFIKVNDNLMVDEIINRLSSLDYSICEDTARQNSIGKKEICVLYNKKYCVEKC